MAMNCCRLTIIDSVASPAIPVSRLADASRIYNASFGPQYNRLRIREFSELMVQWILRDLTTNKRYVRVAYQAVIGFHFGSEHLQQNFDLIGTPQSDGANYRALM